MKKIFYVFPLVFVLAVSCSKEQPQMVPVQPTQNTAKNTEISKNENEKKLEWKTYKNKQFGFEFKLPPDWKLTYTDTQSDNSRVLLTFSGPSSEQYFLVGIRKYEKSLDDFLENFNDGKITKIKKFYLDENLAAEVSYSIDEWNEIKAYTVHNGYLYSFDIIVIKYLNVDSTFKFTK